MNGVKAWLADPAKVLAAANRTVGYLCLFLSTEWRAWPLAWIGLVGLLELRKAERL